ncbi:MAG TPA: DUF3048 domain-containing protein [Candidatus Dojkabacteria bacterium]|nr:DUF3048 domain-containing protein [Candidatus Dojkabacteria bacterium]
MELNMTEKDTKISKTTLDKPIIDEVQKSQKVNEPILNDKENLEPQKDVTKTILSPERSKSNGNSLFSKYDNLQLWQKILIVSVLGVTILSIVGYGVYMYVFNQPISPAKIVNLSLNYIEPQSNNSDLNDINSYQLALTDPTVPKTEVSPLNGLLFTKADMDKLKQHRPVAVMTNNHVAARPQSGLSSADIVYEAMTEGGISRYMAIYWSKLPSKVGPIRSAREYYLEWLSEFDALYIHDGCASTTDPRTNACGNIVTFGIKNIGTVGAWRVNDGIRFAPHNEYSSAAYAVEYAKTKNWDGFASSVQSLKFKKDANLTDRGNRTDVKIKLRKDLNNGGTYDSEWIYDKTSNLYQHKIGGQADYDNENNKAPIQAKVVVVQEVTMQDAYDGHSRVIITTTGTGKAVILQDGKITNGTWKKASRSDRTKYYDNKGNEINFNRGLLWITELPKDQGSFDIINQ